LDEIRLGSKRDFRLPYGGWLVGAVAAGLIAAAVALTVAGGGGRHAAGSPSAQAALPKTSTAAAASPNAITITSFSHSSSPPAPGESYVIRGTVQDWAAVSGFGAEVFVVTRRAGMVPARAGRPPWIVSPPAQVSPGGVWVVRLRLANPRSDVEWAPVLMVPSYVGAFPIDVDGGGRPQPPTDLSSELARQGPGAPDIRAIGTSVRSRS
jgi:hypothetical protein